MCTKYRMHGFRYFAGRMAAIGFLLAISATVTTAALAPWYQWRSRFDGALQCAQTSPGPGWMQDSGPYRDAGCLHPLRQVRL